MYTYFKLINGWHCQFLETDLKTALPRQFTFQQPEKIIQLAKRGGGLKTLADRQAIESAIELGRGGIELHLTQEQYAKLTKP